MVFKKALIIILLLTSFLRLPSLFEPFTYGDEGIYLTLGQALKRGVVLYREIHDNKPPLLYFLAALAGSFSNFRLILFFWSFVTIIFFFKLAEELFPKKPQRVVLATGFFAILTSLHSFEGNVANAENFMMLPTIIGFLLILKKKKEKSLRSYLLAGSLFALAALFKIPAVFDFLAVLVFILLLKGKLYAIRHTPYAIIGFLLPFLITFVFFGLQGALPEYLKAVFFQNLPYLSSWVQNQSQTFGFPLSLLSRGFLLILALSLVFLLRRKLSLPAKLVLIWFSFSLFASLLSSRPYPHYLLQTLPSLSLAFGLVFTQTKERIIPFLLAFLLYFSFSSFQFWHYRNRPYYLNFYQFAFGFKSKSDYWADFGGPVKTIYRLAEFANAYTQPQERIFVWGTQPSIYALARRLPAGRYTAAYHIIDFDGFEETMAALRREKPILIIKLKEERIPFPQLESFLEKNYQLVKMIEDAEVYKINQR